MAKMGVGASGRMSDEEGGNQISNHGLEGTGDPDCG
jgi:hypothetical protein